jgi:HK97 family phage portal protein
LREHRESGNERISQIRRELQPEVERTVATRRTQLERLGIEQLAYERRAFEWQELNEQIRFNGALGTSADIDLRVAARKNAVVFACISAIAIGFAEAFLRVLDDQGAPLVDHPAYTMLRRMPNRLSESRLARSIATYTALGGCYLKKNRHLDGRVLGLTPYHRLQVRPVIATGPSEAWVAGYDYIVGGRVEAHWLPSEVIVIQWPVLDPAKPWDCIAPLDAIAAEYGQDNEMTRYATALLRNDAVARTIITMPRPPEGQMTFDPDAREEYREMWSDAYGGDNRGLPAMLGPGQQVQRLSLDLQEMAFDALRRVPESRICSAFRVPAQVVGVTAGLDSGTYANFSEANRAFTQKLLVPLWRDVSDELTRGLADDFTIAKQYWEFRHDLTEVAALAENESSAAERQRLRSERIQALQIDYAAGRITREMAIANAVSQLQETEESADLLFPVLKPGDTGTPPTDDSTEDPA